MSRTLLPSPVALSRKADLLTLVENRTVYSLNAFELNIFETHQQAHSVPLNLGALVLTTMLRGKKVMHLPGRDAFDYLPGESVVVGEQQTMEIDFPEADEQNPTQCLAVAIPAETIRGTVDLLNERYPRIEEHTPWQLDARAYAHLHNTPELAGTLERIIRVSQETSAAKDVLAGFTLQELLVRLMQTQARCLIFDNYQQHLTTHRFAHVVQYIKHNLAEPLPVEKLSEMACMSKATFFRMFKREFGLTPVEYIIQERLTEAKRLLRHPLSTVADVCYRTGFNNPAYFQKLFRKHEGLTPGLYKKQGRVG
ncbi:AraC family transcriptional regulator [Hymenobacter busanensis]|uniref:AraC family transcriptional regulator n=1 Tax=Hymenobacter busanensis TaxID=2607656 RepID=A0A7L4ZXF4_9BACT|nr:AraC family transcriptional regulator [Hymenobacter busanensis]KAA9332156.1 AraC family transcriptional regulator [Hymenobacter busanensis]QHJ07505.1 helix-turn-helix domain-containing protein [Hymenobacter busanensis]